MEMWVREEIECSKQSAMGDFCWSSKEQNADENVNSKTQIVTKISKEGQKRGSNERKSNA